MKQYLDAARNVLENGTRLPNRTGIDTIMVPGMHFSHDMADGFPILTTRNIPVKSAMGEVCAFLRGTTDAAEFKSLYCGYWEDNANNDGVDMSGNPVPNQWLKNPFRQGENDLGRVYGAQWRKWKAFKRIDDRAHNAEEIIQKMIKDGWQYAASSQHEGVYYKEIDQIRNCINSIVNNPNDRRIIFHAWNPGELDEMALPPCHLLYQFLVNTETKELNLCMYQRSADAYLGVPSNIMSCGFLLSVVAHLTGYKPGKVNIFFADYHYYVNSIDAVKVQLEREPLPLPKLIIADNIPSGLTDVDEIMYWLEAITPNGFLLDNYQNHGPTGIKVAMAV